MTDAGFRVADLDSRSLAKQTSRLLIIPIGALEAHGPQNPLGADSIQAEVTAAELAPKVGALVAPPLSYGVCPGAAQFPGTVTIRMSTMALLVEEVVAEFARVGFRRILLLSGHGSMQHMAALREGGQRAMAHYPTLKVAALCDYDYVYELRGKEAPASDGHGGFLETSRLMALVPDLVGPERPAAQLTTSRYALHTPTREEWPESVIGDTQGSSAEAGRRIQAHVLDRLQRLVQEVLPE